MQLVGRNKDLVKILSLVIALFLTILVGFGLPFVIEPFNDEHLSNATIIDVPQLLTSLKVTQTMGVHMCVHGFRHEDYATLSPIEAKQKVEEGITVFNKAGLIPAAFITPYGNFDLLLKSERDAIASTGIATRLPVSSVVDSIPVGYGWRTMSSYSDLRYEVEKTLLMREKPDYILLHVQDWNPYLKSLLDYYFRNTDRTKITVRIDDIEVNTSTSIVYDMATLLNYPMVDYIAYSVIPAGLWRGGDPHIFGIEINWILRFYWGFLIVTTFLPFSFLLTWRLLSRDKKMISVNHESIKLVSLIVPAYNEEKNIVNCVQAILDQDYKGKKEIIVVDDGSSDDTSRLISGFPVKLISLDKNSGKANALNIGIKNSHGSIIIFTDSDSIIDKSALTNLLKHFNNDQIGGVTGNVLVSDENSNMLTYFQAIEYKIEQEINRYLQSRNGKVLVCPGPLFAIRSDIVHRIMFNDRTAVEDADFTLELLKNDVKIIQERNAVVYTNPPKKLSNWINQRKRWWFGNLQVMRLHEDISQNNFWLILNYYSFPLSIITLFMLMMLPLLFSMYENLLFILQRGFLYTLAPIIIFFILLIPIFINDHKLLLRIIPYILLYSTLKVLLVSYIFIRYELGLGIGIKFGQKYRVIK